MRKLISVLFLVTTACYADDADIIRRGRESVDAMYQAGQPAVTVAETITLHIHGHEFTLTTNEAMKLRDDLLKWKPCDCGATSNGGTYIQRFGVGN